MQTLNLGSVQIPISAATKTFAILAKRGAGKTYTAAVMAEEFWKNNIPFVVFDPIDVWWGLRLNKNGKDKGLPVVVFGTEHADIKLDRDMGKRIAHAVVTENISCIISTFGMPKVAERHLIAEFAEEILRLNTTPRHIFIEEAHEFIPQRVFGGISKTFNNVSNLVVMGGNRRLGVTLINQRAATVNKDVLTQIDTLLAFQNTSPQDRKALKEWVEFHSAEGDFNKFMDSLPSLPKGEGWIWSPEFMNIFKKIKIRKRETFHPDREKASEEVIVPPLADQEDVQNFIQRFNQEKETRSTFPVIKKGEEIVYTNARLKEMEIINIKNDYESRLIQKDVEINSLKADVNHLSNVIRKVKEAIGASDGEPSTVSLASNSDSVQLWQGILKNGLAGKIFKFMSENPSRKFTREQICLAVGVASRAGHTNNEFAKLTRKNLIVRDGNQYQLNPNL